MWLEYIRWWLQLQDLQGLLCQPKISLVLAKGRWRRGWGERGLPSERNHEGERIVGSGGGGRYLGMVASHLYDGIWVTLMVPGPEGTSTLGNRPTSSSFPPQTYNYGK